MMRALTLWHSRETPNMSKATAYLALGASALLFITANTQAEEFDAPASDSASWTYHITVSDHGAAASSEDATVQILSHDKASGYRVFGIANTTMLESTFGLEKDLTIIRDGAREQPLKFPLIVGEKWRLQFYQSEEDEKIHVPWRVIEYVVAAAEEISVPAGKFPTMRIEATAYMADAVTGRAAASPAPNPATSNLRREDKTTYWYASDVQWFVKRVVEEFDSAGARQAIQTEELVRYEVPAPERAAPPRQASASGISRPSQNPPRHIILRREAYTPHHAVLPADLTAAVPAGPAILVALEHDGRIHLGLMVVADLDDLSERLRVAAESNPQIRVNLRIDRVAYFASVSAVVSAVVRAGIEQIGFITEPSSPPEVPATSPAALPMADIAVEYVPAGTRAAEAMSAAEPATPRAAAPPSPITITADFDGTYYWDATPLPDRQALEAKLAEIGRAAPEDQPVMVVRATVLTRYEFFVDAIASIHRSGLTKVAVGPVVNSPNSN
jgi:biopolymer transport protein ExbD